ncbi:MAG: hypothetical protein KY476_03985 [Planctomycetes bacterium]|nr:hypothetical protein [Planctomycetota bacterium]
MVPSDWEAQHLQGPDNPVTVADWKAALDITVKKQGVFCLVFHPHGWIKPEQVVELIEHAVEKHGRKVKFLTFRECLERLDKRMLRGHSLRKEHEALRRLKAKAMNNGIAVIDIDHDGYQDAVIANPQLKQTRIWSPAECGWKEYKTPFQLLEDVYLGPQGIWWADFRARFGVLHNHGYASFVEAGALKEGWTFNGKQWNPEPGLPALPVGEIGPPPSPGNPLEGIDTRLRDLDRDSIAEIFRSNDRGDRQIILKKNAKNGRWKSLPFTVPRDTELGFVFFKLDKGLRFVDIDKDGHDDIVFSNHERYSIHLWKDTETGWSRTILSSARDKPTEGSIVLPPIVREDGTNNGFFVHSRHLFWQNEDTSDLPDLVHRVSFDELLKHERPGPKSAEASLKDIVVPPGFEVELVAAEPLVVDPVAFEWGADGRLWVAEMGDYPLGVPEEDKQRDRSPRVATRGLGGRVRVLADTDGDGRYDASTLFLDGLNYPSGVMPWRNGVLVTAAPEVLYAEDTDGDGRADKREVLFSGFGEGNQQHRVNGLVYGLDGWVHCANGDSNGVIRSMGRVSASPPLLRGGPRGGRRASRAPTLKQPPPAPP